MSPELLPVLVTAFTAGVLGAGHCFGMCGGIAGGFGALATGRSAVGSALLFNSGRIISYGLLGGAMALVVGVAGDGLGVPGWSRWLRLLTSVLIAMIGLRFLFDWQGLARIEQVGAGLWRHVAPLINRAAQSKGPLGRLALGLTWGFLPCGMVYTLLLTAMSTGAFVDGFLTMLAFGVGTLPALLGMTLWAPALATFLQEKATRRIVGAGLLLVAGWTLFVLWNMGGAHAHHHHH
ncbi:MAG: sulfite exporter TauE/SafE family protein [Pseudomonadota bacterium]